MGGAACRAASPPRAARNPNGQPPTPRQIRGGAGCGSSAAGTRRNASTLGGVRDQGGTRESLRGTRVRGLKTSRGGGVGVGVVADGGRDRGQVRAERRAPRQVQPWEKEGYWGEWSLWGRRWRGTSAAHGGGGGECLEEQ